MNAHGAVLHLAAIAVVLTGDRRGTATAFGRAGFIDRADRLVVSVLARDNLLAAIPQLLFIPLDRFQKKR